MPENIYQIVSLGARYWFVFLGALIVLRSCRWLLRERSNLHRRLRRLPDAGMIGELIVASGNDQLPEGTALPVPREGVLGFVRSCDIIVPVDEVHKQHLDFRFENGKGLLIMPRSGCWALVNGHELNCRSRYGKYPMEHGSVLEIGTAVLKLRLFAGVDISRNAAFASDHTRAVQPDDTKEEILPWDRVARTDNVMNTPGMSSPWEPYAAGIRSEADAYPRDGAEVLPSAGSRDFAPGTGLYALRDTAPETGTLVSRAAICDSTARTEQVVSPEYEPDRTGRHRSEFSYDEDPGQRGTTGGAVRRRRGEGGSV